MPRTLASHQLPDLVTSRDRVFLAGGTGEPSGILAEWRRARCLAGVTFAGIQIPMLNHFDPRAYGAGCRFRTPILTPALRAGFEEGVVDLLPMHYRMFYDYLTRDPEISVAVFQVAPPDAKGQCSLGPCADFLPAMIERHDVRLIAQVNPAVPVCRNAPSIPFAQLSAVFETETPLPELKSERHGDVTAVADRVASLIEDGDCIQLGIGRLPLEVFGMLHCRRELVIHSGLVGAQAFALVEQGAASQIVTGIAVGNAEFYRRIAASTRVFFRPVSETHDQLFLSRYRRIVAINSALEVDLFGQVNAEVAAGRLASSFGGLNDFLRAAHRAPLSCAVVALSACRPDGTSRIVPTLSAPGLVSAHRGDVDLVVTEEGVADLRAKAFDARAEALIAIAAPQTRDGLRRAWRQLRAALC